MTGSLVLPLKALLINVVSLGASLGVLVWVFQQGHLEGLLGFTSVGAIESTIPLLVFAFGFGLSMDYEVFLLSRIVELHEQGCTDGEAVVAGPAALRTDHHLGRAAHRHRVRAASSPGSCWSSRRPAWLWRSRSRSTRRWCGCCWCPATMTLLGRWNWWAPAPLRRWHERFGITEEGAPAVPETCARCTRTTTLLAAAGGDPFVRHEVAATFRGPRPGGPRRGGASSARTRSAAGR